MQPIYVGVYILLDQEYYEFYAAMLVSSVKTCLQPRSGICMKYSTLILGAPNCLCMNFAFCFLRNKSMSSSFLGENFILYYRGSF